MECETSDSKKLFKVFESKKKKCRKKREVLDDSVNSQATMESNSAVHSVKSAKAILTSSRDETRSATHAHAQKRDRDSSPSGSPCPVIDAQRLRSPRRHRRSQKEGLSLALKAGLVSTPRSISPQQVEEMMNESVPQDQDSFIYAFLEEAIKKDKKCRQKHARRHEERRSSHDCEPSAHDHRHHHHRRRRDASDVPALRDEKEVLKKAIDQSLLLETFAKLCIQMNEKVTATSQIPIVDAMRTQSHKSLQCEVQPKRDVYDIDQRPTKLRNQEILQDNIPTSMSRSQDNIHERPRSNKRSPISRSPSAVERKDKYFSGQYLRENAKYSSKFDLAMSRTRMADERYRQYLANPDKTRPDHDYEHRYRGQDFDHRYRVQDVDRRECREYDDRRIVPTRDRRNYGEHHCEQKTSRSFDMHRDYVNDERNRRTSRSDSHRRRFEDSRDLRVQQDKRYEEPREFRDSREKKFDDHREKYCDAKYGHEFKERHHSNVPSRDRRSRRNVDRCDRNSVVSRDDDYNRERDRYSDREKDSGLSVADGDTSTVSGRSNYLKVVKQEIAEQREAMDKMMKLWKELMRCFKGISLNQGQEKSVQDSAAHMQESAAAQLRLWRECMRRYETVARDVGDTDARLMEEINKQRSEMAEMANMWQECLQRYRDMSCDFNNLKQKLATSESPTRLPAASVVCPEGEGAMPSSPYRLPPNYPPPPMPPLGGYGNMGPGGGGLLRPRSSMPPAWWWCGDPQLPPPQRRRSSPESRESPRASRSRERRHRRKDRDEPRYKEKTSSKANAARSDHKHRKR
ncbi:cyclin-dependent kinase 12-like isoform X2 [Hyposmocoma kahamanoa]|uniref:cyclin-dependent kinase 12-like isoform X2 n=1 Tax=Hyposmocoma kahamanoa TaxID=1477025 RepID=UPI000E6D73B5|nr:cyclin-dependent kinase 12-like isoform X2 [Hyposmocoma kahamanoa]